MDIKSLKNGTKIKFNYTHAFYQGIFRGLREGDSKILLSDMIILTKDGNTKAAPKHKNVRTFFVSKILEFEVI